MAEVPLWRRQAGIHRCRCDTAAMRHLRPPHPGTVRLAGVAEIIAGLVLVLIWVSVREVLYLVLALALVAAGLATLLSAGSEEPSEPDADEEFEDLAGDDDPDSPNRMVGIDRSALPGESEQDNRTDVEPELVPTLSALVTWLDEHDYLPVDQGAPKSTWTLRLGLRRAVVLDASGEVHFVLPAETPLGAGDHLTAQYRARR